MMRVPDTADLLRVWEQGTGKSAAIRALLLMKAICPESDSRTLGKWCIGQRDRLLLDLRYALFGADVQCLTDCANCGEPLELEFRIDDIRAPHGEPGRSYPVDSDGFEVRFRLPDTGDLLALDGDSLIPPERQLLERCLLDVRSKEGEVDLGELPNTVLSAVGRGMRDADPQAEVVLEVSCPACSTVSRAPFDVVSHLWTELDAWARRMLREVHAIALAFGWNETDILAMSASRRRAYLDLIGA
jgi:hypothetical protein